MRIIALAASVSLAAIGLTTAASAHARCDGDFELIHGDWVATRHCQIQAAESASHGHYRISERPTTSHEMTPEEYCRFYGSSIETQPYCLNYAD
jgi:hypothetical protein